MPRAKAEKQAHAQFDKLARDQAFEPRASFDFEENSHVLGDDSASFDSFDGGGMDFSLADGMFDENLQNGVFGGQSASFSMDSNAFAPGMSNTDPANMGPGCHSGMHSMSQFPINDIVSKRKNNVQQQFGQITPPDSNTLSPAGGKSVEEVAKTEEDIAKANRTQRARNAANKRHSKTKKRKDSPQDEEVEEVDEDDGQIKTATVQREKNRVAAAKCRAKKKATSEEMQDVHREGARQNSFLHREMRELRDQKAFLRNSLLQHAPGICQCHAIHRFNLAQAQQMAMGVGAMIPQPMSPSQDSGGSINTPSSDVSRGRHYSTGGPSVGSPMGAGGPNMQSRRQSVGNTLVTGLSQAGFPDPMQMQMQHDHGQSMPQMSQLSDFLQGSPNGHVGYQ